MTKSLSSYDRNFLLRNFWLRKYCFYEMWKFVLLSVLSYNIVISSVVSPQFDGQTRTIQRKNHTEVTFEGLTPDTEYLVRIKQTLFKNLFNGRV